MATGDEKMRMELRTVLNTEFLADVCWALHTTESEVARRAGLSVGMIFRIKSPDSNPTQATLDKIASAMLCMAFEQELIEGDQVVLPLSRYIDTATDLRRNLVAVELVVHEPNEQEDDFTN